MLFKHDHSNTQFMIYGGLGFYICLSNILNDRLPNHLSKDVTFSIKWQLFTMVDEMCVKMVDLKGQTALALSAWRRWCHPNTVVTFVELGVYLWMCLATWGYGCVCVCACAAEGVAVSQDHVDSLHKEIAKGQRQSCWPSSDVLCVPETCSVYKGLFAQGANRATLLALCALAWIFHT